MSGNSTRITVPALRQRKSGGPKIAMVTAYDYTMARLVDGAGVDVILVGDSAGSVIQGQPTTLPVTLEQMAYHCRCVTRGAERALVVGDLPFMSYQVSPERALESAGKLLQEGVAAVKLEGGIHMATTIERLAQVDIPVMGHVGLTPQSYHRMGGYKIQGKPCTDVDEPQQAGSRERVIEDAVAVEQAGAFAVVLECIPADLALEITGRLSIPTIGIGAGAYCDGQVLVCTDMLGMSHGITPKFVKQFAQIGDSIGEAVRQYIDEVRAGTFPAIEHSVVSKSIGLDPEATEPNKPGGGKSPGARAKGDVKSEVV